MAGRNTVLEVGFHLLLPSTARVQGVSAFLSLGSGRIAVELSLHKVLARNQLDVEGGVGAVGSLKLCPEEPRPPSSSAEESWPGPLTPCETSAPPFLVSKMRLNP